MNCKLIMLPNPILVSDERIEVGDSYHTSDYRIVKWLQELEDFSEGASSYPKPIIAGIEGLPKLDLSAIAERIGWIDVEKVKFDYFESVTFGWDVESLERYSYEVQQDAEAYVKGFKAAQSLNEKKFTLSEMEQCWLQAQECVLGTDDFPMGGNNFKYPSFKEYIHSLSKPKEYNVISIFDEKTNSYKIAKIV